MSAQTAKNVTWFLLHSWLPRWVCFLVLVGVLASLGSGCTRRFFRNTADREAQAIIAEKDVSPLWQVMNFHVEPDPRARFANPTNPDRQPMPPDDPGAADLAPNPQRPKGGIAWVESQNFLELLAAWDVENRLRRQLLGMEESDETEAYVQVEVLPDPQKVDPKFQPCCPCVVEQKPYLITLQQAVELGIINSREFQTQREDLFLTALPVTLQRFSFASQFFFTEQAVREYAGRQHPAGPQNRWLFDTNTGFTKLFPTGALLVLRFANQTVINLTGGPRDVVSVSNLNFDIIQPFLRGGGRAVTLEGLTQAERNMVYQVRSYARFRKQFYVAIAGGRDALPGAGAPVGFGGAVSPGAIAGVQTPIILPGGAGRVILATGQLAPATGYLPTLLQAAFVENEKKNIIALEVTLNEFLREQLRGLETQLRVEQVESDLLQSQNILRQREQDFRDALDRFKLQLGLPVNLPLDLDDAPLRPIKEHLQKYEKTYGDFEKVNANVQLLVKKIDDLQKPLRDLDVERRAKLEDEEDPEKRKAIEEEFDKKIKETLEKIRQEEPKLMDAVSRDLREELNKLFQRDPALAGTELRKTYRQEWDRWKDLEDAILEGKLIKLREQIEKLEDLFKSKLEKELERQKGAPRQVVDEEQQRKLLALQREYDWGELERSVRLMEGRPWLKETQPALVKAKFEESFKGAEVNFMIILLRYGRSELLEQLRRTWPDLPDVVVQGCDVLKARLEQAEEAVAQTALANRLDLMNARAQVVDAWRQIEIFANSLLGVFNVRYHLDSITPPGEAKPLAFSGSRTRHQLILNAELPLVRKAERNNYRASLIGYERARRAMMAAEDFVVNTTRQEVRTLRTLQANYEVLKLAIHLAYAQVDGARREKTAPPRPGAADIGSGGNAALTQQLLNALRRNVQAQNQIYALWVDYLITRLQLYRDLELMTLDQRGEWIDENATDEASACHGTGSPGDERGPAPERLPEPERLLEPLPPPELVPPVAPGLGARLGPPQ